MPPKPGRATITHQAFLGLLFTEKLFLPKDLTGTWYLHVHRHGQQEVTPAILRSLPSPRDTPIHVLLNKTDLFADMIQEVPLSCCFPEYEGPPGEVLPAISFIEGELRRQECLPCCDVGPWRGGAWGVRCCRVFVSGIVKGAL